MEAVISLKEKDEPKPRKTEEPKRDNWGNRTEFLLSCLGYAIGLGNVWRFPYLCYRNGGGAFLVPYLLMLFLCGIPLFLMETTLGQFASTGFLTIFNICPILKGSGYTIIIVNVIFTTYCTVILSYPIVFLYHCLQPKLPWEDCGHSWNTPECVELHGTSINGSNFLRKSPADEFFHNEILKISPQVDEMGGLVGHLFWADLLAWIIIFICIQKGVKSIGKVVYFTATFPFIILFILFLRGITLPGAKEGILFYIYPDWNQLKNLKTWADAACQIFFSLGPGWGGIINMASFNQFRNNNKADSIIVPIVNCGTSIFAGFVVFSVLGFMSHKTGLPVSKVATSGPGLAFVAYPEAISMLPVPHLWAVLFFFMLFLLGLGTVFVQLESIIASIIDLFPRLRRHKTLVTLGITASMFLLSLFFVTNGGMYILQLLDWYSASIPVILVCMMELLIVGWIYGVENFIRDLEFMIGVKVSKWWPFCWAYLTPILLTFVFMATIAFNTTINYNGMIYPDWMVMLGWSSCIIAMAMIPATALWMTWSGWHDGASISETVKNGLKANQEWGPRDLDVRKEWLSFIQQKH